MSHFMFYCDVDLFIICLLFIDIIIIIIIMFL